MLVKKNRPELDNRVILLPVRAMKPNPQRLLKKFRQDFGVSLAELAGEAKLSEAMLSRFEAGNRKLSPEAWTRVLAAIQKLLAEEGARRKEDDARRKREREKAVQTTAALFTGVLGFPVTPGFAELFTSFSPEVEREIEKEGARIAKSAELVDNLLVVEKSKALRQLKNPRFAKQLLELYFALIEWR